LAAPPADPYHRQQPPPGDRTYPPLARHLATLRHRVLHDSRLKIPNDAIYLNVAQHAFEHARYFRWLKRRADICCVFAIHDLLSVDYPEYFPPRNLQLFRRRLNTAFEYADAFITSTQTVRARLEKEIGRVRSRERPIHVQAFASPLEDVPIDPPDVRPPDGNPYFIMIGTIEPRKNHLLVLHIWRELVVACQNAPKLLLVGERGWENEQVMDILDRSVALRSHIVWISRATSKSLAGLLRGAHALLMPSYDEGYGLPLVEALSLGTPVIASDIPVFHEVTQGWAKFISPTDGPGWHAEILRLSHEPDYYQVRREATQQFKMPTWQGYFAGVEQFSASL
jgi:glycosyltransferase involved in cell wall biosynthesis